MNKENTAMYDYCERLLLTQTGFDGVVSGSTNKIGVDGVAKV